MGDCAAAREAGESDAGAANVRRAVQQTVRLIVHIDEAPVPVDRDERVGDALEDVEDPDRPGGSDHRIGAAPALRRYQAVATDPCIAPRADYPHVRARSRRRIHRASRKQQQSDHARLGDRMIQRPDMSRPSLL